ncbi:MAG: YtxH domain-containing protein [Chloroflexota bacterium]|jgi:gas vesicle protein
MRGFLLGAIVGALAGVLVAPRRGEETREILRSRADVWQAEIMNRLDQATGELEGMRRDIMARLDDMRSQLASYREQEGRGGERAARGEELPPEPPPTAYPDV